jgi:SAM-dependent methyltransferase
MDEKKIVSDGYDLVSEAYRSEDFDYEKSGYSRFLSWLEPRLPQQSQVLDLGCGCGIPVARVLSRRFRVVGVDISPVQIERARQLVPDTEFHCADFMDIPFPPESFQAVVAFYSIIHIPLAEQPALFDKITSWLEPNGFLLASVGWQEWTGTEPDWRGVSGATMYWSHADADTYRRWLLERGFDIVQEDFLSEGDSGHAIFLAQFKRKG